ncbi:MAG: CvpA family protein [Deltaproteobacteria bacterium]|jgi:hypothetical protein|nr:CvpA family protein [Deltaproteobacteria bacterium]
MELPVIGYLGSADLVLAAFFLMMTITGLARGLGGELRWLVAALISLCASLNPTLHDQVIGWLSFLSDEAARATAYVGVYYIAQFVILIILNRATPLGEIKLGGALFRLFGGLSALLRAFIDATMFIILAAGWRIPWGSLYRESGLADRIVDIWHKMGFLGELYAAFTISKFTNF